MSYIYGLCQTSWETSTSRTSNQRAAQLASDLRVRLGDAMVRKLPDTCEQMGICLRLQLDNAESLTFAAGRVDRQIRQGTFFPSNAQASAWPAKLVEALAKNFTVITFDNRGTWTKQQAAHRLRSRQYGARRRGLLDEIGIESTYVVLGYSMGGAIAQEFTRQYAHRVAGLILCATMCGGPRATYAEASLVRVMRDLDGLSAEQIARRIWEVTYTPGYLRENRGLAEDQMRRETALPTPLHAADLQFQAFAEFDSSKALSQIRCPTLVLTGDLDHRESRSFSSCRSSCRCPRDTDAKSFPYVVVGLAHFALHRGLVTQPK